MEMIVRGYTFQMILQIGLVGSDGIILASDTCMTKFGVVGAGCDLSTAC
jgi:hypothetical protein